MGVGGKRESEEDVTMLEGQSDTIRGLDWPLLALEMEGGNHEPGNAGGL